ncbi:hypothetical protein GCM10027589_33530 [Actinocorallia lasiicapitis]
MAGTEVRPAEGFTDTGGMRFGIGGPGQELHSGGRATRGEQTKPALVPVVDVSGRFVGGIRGIARTLDQDMHLPYDSLPNMPANERL